jgi:hypothetical protein
MLGAFLYRKLYSLSGSDVRVRRKSKTKKVPIYIFGKRCSYRRRIDIGICGALQFSERYIQFLDPTSESGNPKIEKKISRTFLPKAKPCAPVYTATRNFLITLFPIILLVVKTKCHFKQDNLTMLLAIDRVPYYSSLLGALFRSC